MNALVEQLPYPRNVIIPVLRLPLLAYRLGLGWLAGAAKIMVLTTRGRSSGMARHAPIEFRRHGKKIYVVSAWGKRPDWYKNLVANPLVSLKIGQQNMAAQATTVEDPAEALRVLLLFRKTNPVIYDAILARLSNEKMVDLKTLPAIASRFTIVRFDPVNEPSTLPTIKSNLVWVWPVALVGLMTAGVIAWITRVERE
jgi:deazaflavin-dependent oxidoreductase (nitroreductase family)